MEQKDKELLLKDLCSRLPYYVKADIGGGTYTLFSICNDDGFYINVIEEASDEWYEIDRIKPYLFPISSMTEDQCIKLFEILGMGVNSNYGGDYVKINDVTGITFFFESGRDIEAVMKAIDYLNSIHVDYRGLIPKGLAIDATNLNIYNHE